MEEETKNHLKKVLIRKRGCRISGFKKQLAIAPLPSQVRYFQLVHSFNLLQQISNSQKFETYFLPKKICHTIF